MAGAVGAAGAAPGAQPSGSAREQMLPGQVVDLAGDSLPTLVGIAFSPARHALYVVGGRRSSAASTTEVLRLTPFSHGADHRASSARLAAAIEDPIDLVFDVKHSRLLFIDKALELRAVEVKADGGPDPSTLSRLGALRVGLHDPQGLAVDPSAGTLYILDAAGPRIVRAEPSARGGFRVGTSIDLSKIGIRGPRGLAFDPSKRHLYLRAGTTLYELTLQGDVAATYDLSGAGLVKPDGMVVAPSRDRTDDPSQMNVYFADGGGTPHGTGQIVEVSLAAVASASIDFSSSLVRTTNTAAWSPPSPDPSGIDYLPGSDRMIVSDGEVEETVNGITHFQGANVWETDRSGNVLRSENISRVPPTVVPMTNEPTGVAFDPASGVYYFSDDGTLRVHALRPGADGLVGTSDDSWTAWATDPQDTDPEGVAFDTFADHVFVVDGLNREVYEYTIGGALLNHFDTLQYGVSDPEGIQFNPVSGTFFVLSNARSGDGTQTLVAEVTRAGALVRTIDVSSANPDKPADIAYAPASDGSGPMHFYVVDRGVDNNVDPNENDGRMYEFTAPTPDQAANTPPTVSAGPDASAVLPASASLDGTVTDDGNPNPPHAVTTTWTQAGGPGVLTFANANAVDTTATASVSGVYTARLTANDGQFSASDDTTLVFSGSGGTQSFDASIVAGADDAEEETNNTVLVGNSDLDMMVGNEGNLVVGVRFRNVTIPKGAPITNAYVQFMSKEAQSGPSSLTIKGQAADNPPVFTTATSDISSRSTTTAAVPWAPPAWLAGEAGLAERTGNLASVIQEIVNRSGWASGNALALLVTGTGTRVAYSYNATSFTPPSLHVEWSSGSGNSSPQITSDGGGDTASRSVAENQTAVTTVTATDPDGNPLTYSISGGADAARFTIGSSSGVLSFVSVPNYEAPTDADGDNVYNVTVTVSDGQGGTDTQALAVTVLNVDEFAPVISSNGGGATGAVSVPENQTGATTVVASDGDGDPITYSIFGGADAGAFSINPTTGVLTFTSAPDFENPTDANHDNVYEVTVAASDGSLDDDQALSVTVTDVVETGGDTIFADGFESGSFSAWSSATTGGGDLSVTAAAAHPPSTRGTQATINDASPIYVRDDSPAAETRYRARFWFNPNGIAMATNDAHFAFQGQNGSGVTVVRVEFRWNGKKYQVRAAAAKDGTAFVTTTWFPITNTWHAIEFDWRASSGPGANTGELTLWLDGVQKADKTGIDNDTRRVESARLGALDGIDAGTHGTYYFDDFASTRSTYIGP